MIISEEFGDNDFYYTLFITPTDGEQLNIHTESQGHGYSCTWRIEARATRRRHEVKVTDDNCYIIVFPTVESARMGAKRFVSLIDIDTAA